MDVDARPCSNGGLRGLQFLHRLQDVPHDRRQGGAKEKVANASDADQGPRGSAPISALGQTKLAITIASARAEMRDRTAFDRCC